MFVCHTWSGATVQIMSEGWHMIIESAFQKLNVEMFSFSSAKIIHCVFSWIFGNQLIILICIYTLKERSVCLPYSLNKWLHSSVLWLHHVKSMTMQYLAVVSANHIGTVLKNYVSFIIIIN